MPKPLAPHQPSSRSAHVRTRLVVTVLLVLAALVAIYLLGSGDVQVSPGNAIRAVFGAGDPADVLAVQQWRLPRVLSALLVGAMLGVAGAIFQSLTRNPLGSPDIIGFNTGAYTGALVVLLVTGSSAPLGVTAGALLGGLGTAVAVYLLAYRQGVQGFRLIIVGIALSAMLTAANSWLILKAELPQAIGAAQWGAGSLNDATWGSTLGVCVAAAVLLAPCLWATRPLRQLELGDDLAAALGLRVEPARRALLVLGVLLTAVSAASYGPIAFVALAAPQLARRLTSASGAGLGAAAAMGALVLLASDGLAQRLVTGGTLPAGVVTVCVGGLYLVWLLFREARRT
nr:iron chelate uptake ABC transporter family permease subunit [Nakamurella aerolata]